MAPHDRTRDGQATRGTDGRTGGSLAGLLGIWGVTRAALLLCVLKVLVFPGPDVTSDVSVIYRGWYDVLVTGTFPQDDVTWQYPPAAALAVLSPAVLPFLEYATAFFVLALAADAVTLALLLRGARGAAGPGVVRGCGWRAYRCSVPPCTRATT